MKKLISFRPALFSTLLAAFAVTLSLTSCAPIAGHLQSEAPATQSTTDYSREDYRLVAGRDEIVARLANGMTVIVKRVPSPVLAVRAYVLTGSMYEGQWLGSGVSHLLEHLVAGGSNARRTEAQNRDLLQAIGNNSNAYTSEEHTAYYVNTTPDNLDSAVDLVSGWVLTCSIAPDEFRREQQVVQREVETDAGNADTVFFRLARSNRYLVSPARISIIGRQGAIQSLTREDVQRYYAIGYQPNNMVFSVAGNLDPEQMLSVVRKYVRDARPGREFSHDVAAEPPTSAPRSLATTFPKLGRAKLHLAFPAPSLLHEDIYALDLLAAILGGGDASMLVGELRDRRQLVDSISSWNETPSYVDGSFVAYMELEPGNIRAATDSVLKMIEDICRNGCDEQRLQRAKDKMAASRAFGLQKSEDIISSIAGDVMMTGDPSFTDRYLERIARVSPQEVKLAAVKYLDASKLITTAMLPEESAMAAGLPGAVETLRSAGPTTKPSRSVELPVERFALKDGTVVLLKRMAASPVVSIQMYAMGGLCEENEATNGLGNLAMSSLHRGTKTRSADEIAEFLDARSGSFAAACGNNVWSWSASCLGRDFAQTFDLFADVVLNPAFAEDQVALVRQRTLAAIDGQNDNTFSVAMRFFRGQFFGPAESPYRFMPLGESRLVKTFTADQVRKWYFEKVLKSKRVIAIYGDISLAEARKAAVSRFGPEGSELRQAKDGGIPPLRKPVGGPSINVSQVLVNKSDNPQAAVIIGFKSNNIIGDADQYPLLVGRTMLSGYDFPTGFIFERLRGLGLVYDAGAFDMPGRDTQHPGVFAAYAQCDPADVNQVVDEILVNMARLQGADRDMQPDWFLRSKKLAITAHALASETAASQARDAALNEVYGLGYDYEDRFADNVGAVTLSAIRSVAAARLNDCIVTISTPRDDLVTVKDGLRKYAAFPAVDLTPQSVRHDSK